VRVALAADIADGIAGGGANVASLLTGAAGMGGFKGLGERYDRRNLLVFAADIPLELRFSRIDGRGQSMPPRASTGCRPTPSSAAAAALPGRIADAPERREFGRLWQERVCRLCWSTARTRRCSWCARAAEASAPVAQLQAGAESRCHGREARPADPTVNGPCDNSLISTMTPL